MISPLIAQANEAATQLSTAAAPLMGNAGLAVLGAGIGIGLIGMKAAESTGRNPSAFGKVLVIAIILAALVEGVAFTAIFIAS